MSHWKVVVPALLVATAWACGGSDPVEQAPPLPEAIEMPPEPDASLSVPSPVEVQASIQAAGIDRDLATVVPTWNFKFERASANVVAVRVGVLLADLVLTAKTASKEELLQRIGHLKEGVKTLELSGKLGKVLDSLAEQVEADALGRDELLVQLDELSQKVLNDPGSTATERLLPLVKAGVWLEGTYGVAEAIRQHGDAGPADRLLRQPEVVAYFQRYAKAEGVPGASREQADLLDRSLATLHAVATHPAPLEMSHVEAVIQAVDAVLTEI